MAAAVSVPHDFVGNADAVADEVDANFNAIVAWINTNAVHLDGSKAMSGSLSIPLTPSSPGHAASKQYVDNSVPSGFVGMYGGASAPSGWLLCQGQAVSRVSYASLFTAIGTSFGAGDGSTTFNLPDLRGRAPLGAGTGTGLTARTLGQQVGNETVALSGTELPSHLHTVSITTSSVGDHTHSSGATLGFTVQNNTPGGSVSTSAGPYTATNAGATAGAGAHNHTVTGNTGNTGTGTGHNNMQPSLGINFIIKV